MLFGMLAIIIIYIYIYIDIDIVILILFSVTCHVLCDLILIYWVETKRYDVWILDIYIYIYDLIYYLNVPHIYIYDIWGWVFTFVFVDINVHGFLNACLLILILISVVVRWFICYLVVCCPYQDSYPYPYPYPCLYMCVFGLLCVRNMSGVVVAYMI